MPTLPEFIKEIGTRSGLDEAAIKAVVATIPDAEKVVLPDTFTGATLSSLMNLDQAKANPVVKGFFRAQSLDPLDKEMNKIVAELNDPEFLTEFSAAGTTYAKFPALLAKIQAVAEAKAKAEFTGKKVDKDELQKQYDSLRLERDKIIADSKNEISGVKNTYQTKLSDYALRSKLSAYELANPTDANIDFIINRELINKEALAKGAKIVYNEEKEDFELRDAKDPEISYKENHNDISFQAFTDRTLAASKRLKVSDPNPAPRPAPANPRFPAADPDPARAAIAQQMKDNATRVAAATT